MPSVLSGDAFTVNSRCRALTPETNQVELNYTAEVVLYNILFIISH